MRLYGVLFFLSTALPARSATSSPITCPCGYTVNGTLFTQALETDFLHVQDLARDTNHAWIPQAYNVTRDAANGPYGKASQVENIIPNPIKDANSWSGPGTVASDPGLQVWARSTLLIDDTLVPMAELVSARTDMLYGSFRIGLKTTTIPGTCGAFFFYFDDSNEIDMEFLSSQNSNQTINLVMQSPESERRGYAAGPDFQTRSLLFAPQEDHNEYRFDWLPDRVDFFANSVLLATMRDHIPATAGKLHISHWSDGNPGWSRGPPERDAVLTVSYVKAYFNGSSSGGGQGYCEERCVVPDQKVAPSLVEGDGETAFFTPQGEREGDDRDGDDSQKDSASSFSKGYGWALILPVLLSIRSFVRS